MGCHHVTTGVPLLDTGCNFTVSNTLTSGPTCQDRQLSAMLWLISAHFLLNTSDQLSLSLCQDAVPKCQAFIHQMVQFLSTLEQSGKVTLAVLEQELSKLLDDIMGFNPPSKCHCPEGWIHQVMGFSSCVKLSNSRQRAETYGCRARG